MDDTEIFNWEAYINNYEDLREAGINTEEKAWNHWITYGKGEGRTFNKCQREPDACYFYGNCQAGYLHNALNDHPNLKGKYTFHRFFVGSSITTINIDALRRTQIFVYQYIIATALRNNDAP